MEYVRAVARVVYPQTKDGWVTFALWILLGIFGGHRYYCRAYGTAILQTLTLGGFGLWWVFDLFMLERLVRRRGTTF